MIAAMVMGFGRDANAARRTKADQLVQLRDRVRAAAVHFKHGSSSTKQCALGCRSPLCCTEGLSS